MMSGVGGATSLLLTLDVRPRSRVSCRSCDTVVTPSGYQIAARETLPAGRTCKKVRTQKKPKALREGLDPDDPAVVAARPCPVRTLVAAAAWAALSADSIPAKSVAAAVSISGAALTNDMSVHLAASPWLSLARRSSTVRTDGFIVWRRCGAA